MNDDICYQAMLARDYRFDGKFYVGVKTTGVYCRPICPAKPKRVNVEFFRSALAAEKSGYRPCLRCRPESAPLSPAWNGKSSLVQRALRAITTDHYFDSSEDKFAEKFGVTARHLRRVFVDEVGLTPKQIAFNYRLNFARKLIVETQMSITEIAMTSKFSSLRRFNDAFKKRFHREPRDLRKNKIQHSKEGIFLSLSYRPPFDWQSLLAYYRSHQIIGTEKITEDTYERIFRIGETEGCFKVFPDPHKPQLILQIVSNTPTSDPSIIFVVVQKVREMFDLDSDPLLIANSFRANVFLNQLWKNYPGLRIAKGWDSFEAAVATILGQLVSLAQARIFVHQLVKNYGEPLLHPLTKETLYLFPTPQTLAKSDLLAVKTTQGRRIAIKELARQVLNLEIDFEKPQEAAILKSQLLSIRGIGPWTAEYVSLRAARDTDAFPGTDLILKRAVEKHPDLDLEKIRPWRAYAAVYLWHHYAEKLSKKTKRLA